MPGGGPPSLNHFTCPNCGAFYQLVKAEAGRETDSREINCRACGDPLAGREGEFVLKYFLLRKGIRSRRAAPNAKEAPTGLTQLGLPLVVGAQTRSDRVR